MHELVRLGKAESLGGDGYPYRFKARAGTLLPCPLEGSPDGFPKDDPAHGVSLHPDALNCQPSEDLIVGAWDES